MDKRLFSFHKRYLFGLLFTFMACHSSEELQGLKGPLHKEGFEVFQRITYPGAASNLAYNASYRIVFSGHTDEAIQVSALLIDSVSLPITYLKIAGQGVEGFELPPGDYDQATWYANRYVYDSTVDSGPLEVQTYALSGLHLIGNSVLEYATKEQSYRLQLGPITEEETIYAP